MEGGKLDGAEWGGGRSAERAIAGGSVVVPLSSGMVRAALGCGIRARPAGACPRPRGVGQPAALREPGLGEVGKLKRSWSSRARRADEPCANVVTPMCRLRNVVQEIHVSQAGVAFRCGLTGHAFGANAVAIRPTATGTPARGRSLGHGLLFTGLATG